MALSKKVTWNEWDEPKVVITIEGWHDVIRFMWHIERAQVEFAAMAFRVADSLKRKVGAIRYRQLVDYTTGAKPWR